MDSMLLLRGSPIKLLRYLGGYVVKKILRKIKNGKNYRSVESQGILCALESMTISDLQDQRLIKTVTRGGLTALNSNGQNMFRIVEEHFRNGTITSMRRIDTQKMTRDLIKNVDMLGFYNNILTTIKIKMDNETRKNLLEKMVSLYLRVRSFSKARDITNKHEVEKKKVKV